MRKGIVCLMFAILFSSAAAENTNLLPNDIVYIGIQYCTDSIGYGIEDIRDNFEIKLCLLEDGGRPEWTFSLTRKYRPTLAPDFYEPPIGVLTIELDNNTGKIFRVYPDNYKERNNLWLSQGKEYGELVKEAQEIQESRYGSILLWPEEKVYEFYNQYYAIYIPSYGMYINLSKPINGCIDADDAWQIAKEWLYETDDEMPAGSLLNRRVQRFFVQDYYPNVQCPRIHAWVFCFFELLCDNQIGDVAVLAVDAVAGKVLDYSIEELLSMEKELFVNGEEGLFTRQHFAIIE